MSGLKSQVLKLQAAAEAMRISPTNGQANNHFKEAAEEFLIKYFKESFNPSPSEFKILAPVAAGVLVGYAQHLLNQGEQDFVKKAVVGSLKNPAVLDPSIIDLDITKPISNEKLSEILNPPTALAAVPLAEVVLVERVKEAEEAGQEWTSAELVEAPTLKATGGSNNSGLPEINL